MHSFMLQDVVSIFAATLLFPLFLVVPGYVLSWAINLFNFRDCRELTRWAISTTISVAVFPTITFLTARLVSFTAVWLIYGVLWMAFIAIWLQRKPSLKLPQERWFRVSLLLIAVWILVAVLSLADLQIGKRVYFSLIAYDYTTRVALTDAVVRTGVPPVNPHFYPGHPAEVSYFYYWSVMCALVSRLTGGLIDARIAFSAGAVWAGLALRAIAMLYCRSRFKAKQNAVAVLFLLFVTGLDFVFVFPVSLLKVTNVWRISEGWNGNSQITAWNGATLWTPHHMAGLIAGLTGILLFQNLSPTMSRRQQALIALVTAFSLASAAGLSIFVTLIFAVFWAVWFVIALMSKERRYQIPWIMLIGTIALLLSTVFLYDLLHNRETGTGEASPFVLSVRTFEPIQPYFDIFNLSHGPQEFINFLALPINYVAELGFFLLAGLIYFDTARHRHVDLLPDTVLLLSSVIICSFVRSSIIASNDLGWRGFMPAQFILLLWSSGVLLSLFPRWTGIRTIPMSRLARRITILLLGVGLLSSAFDLFTLRMFYVLNDLGWWQAPEETTPDQHLGERTYALREAYDFIHDSYPTDAIVQHNPYVPIIDRYQGLYGLRQTIAAGQENGTVYGIALTTYNKTANQVIPLFDGTIQTPEQVLSACHELQIDVLIIKDTDPVWQDHNSWIWQHKPVFSNDFSRVFEC